MVAGKLRVGSAFAYESDPPLSPESDQIARESGLASRVESGKQPESDPRSCEPDPENDLSLSLFLCSFSCYVSLSLSGATSSNKCVA